MTVGASRADAWAAQLGEVKDVFIAASPVGGLHGSLVHNSLGYSRLHGPDFDAKH
jgi:hypothetical protein